MSTESKQTSPESTSNDSPAFRLRPRNEPKSYYSIRLEYSANPAAFTRERPRSGKRKSTSRIKSHVGSSRSTPQKAALLNNRFPNGQPNEQLLHVMTKEELERQESRKQFQRDIAQSITTDTPVSPFIQRLALDELKPNAVYEHNYITLRVESVEMRNVDALEFGSGDSKSISNNSDKRCLICRCRGIDAESERPTGLDASPTQISTTKTPRRVDVHLFDHYANDKLIKVGKIINIGKFKTGPEPSEPVIKQELGEPKHIGMTIVVDHDFSGKRKSPIPIVNVTEMIEEPTEPYVETAPADLDS